MNGIIEYWENFFKKSREFILMISITFGYLFPLFYFASISKQTIQLD